MIQPRGYSTERYNTVNSAYHNKPTKLQVASYDLHLKELMRNNKVDEFNAVLASGISPNPANEYGESILHMVCRRGDTKFLKVLVEHRCSFQVADDYGRTPLHDACWCANPNFDVVEMILDADRRLLHMTDCRGALPLSYVPKDQWSAWLLFLESKKEKYWSNRNVALIGKEQPPQLTQYAAHTRPLLDPPGALPPSLASMVASGRIKPEEAKLLMYEVNDDNADAIVRTDCIQTAATKRLFDSDDTNHDSDTDESSDYDDDSSEYDSDDSMSESSFDDDEWDLREELAIILNRPVAVASAAIAGGAGSSKQAL